MSRWHFPTYREAMKAPNGSFLIANLDVQVMHVALIVDTSCSNFPILTRLISLWDCFWKIREISKILCMMEVHLPFPIKYRNDRGVSESVFQIDSKPISLAHVCFTVFIHCHPSRYFWFTFHNVFPTTSHRLTPPEIHPPWLRAKKCSGKLFFFASRNKEIKSILEKGAGNMSWNHCDDTLIRQLDNVNDMSVFVQDGNRGIAATRLSGLSLSKCFKPINLQLEKDMHTRPKSNLVSLVFSIHLENINQNWTYLKPPPGFSCIVDSLCDGISVLVGLSGSCWLGVSWTKSRHFQVDAAA